MSTHQPSSTATSERLNLREHVWPIYLTANICAVAGLILAIVLGFFHYKSDGTFRRFLFAYLVSYCFILALALGGLFFVLCQHLTKAGWSVNVRRIAEWFAAVMPVVGALSAPIVISILTRKGDLYAWDMPGAADNMTPFKRMYLNPNFVVARLVIYFVIWSIMGIWYWKQSTRQDITGDYRITVRMQALSAPAMVLFAITLTGAAFDLIMSLDYTWFSTIFGVYYFSASVICVFSTIVLTALFLQSRGFLKESVTVEHYHDLGKYLFAFVFFWGYIAFSQFMLQWYGNMPEETEWWKHRGATTVPQDVTAWSWVILAILFGRILIPFAGLLSRHVKRNPKSLAFWAVWMLVFTWIDIFWLIMPEYDGKFHFGLIDIAALIGIGGVFWSVVLRKAAHDSLRPLHDPRLADSLAFENI